MQEQATHPSGLRRLVIAALAVACVVLGALNLRECMRRNEQIRVAPDATVPEEERLAEPTPASPPMQQAGAETTRERRRTAGGRSGPDTVNPAAPAPAEDVRGTAPTPLAPAMGEMPARVEDGGPDGAGSPAFAVPVSGIPPAAAAPGQGSRETAPRAPDPGAAVPAMPRVYVQTPGVVAPKGEPGPRGSGTAPAGRDTTPGPETPVDEEPGADHTPPVLQALRFDPPVVEGGMVTTLTVQASDDLSGLQSVWGEIRSPNRSAVLPFGARGAGSDGGFSFAIGVPRDAQAGVWYVSLMSLTDAAGNTSVIRAPSPAAAPPGGTFSAFSSEPDSTPPEVLQVWFEKPTVGAGEKNAIRVEARDDQSGVASMVGAVQSPSRSALIWFNGTMNQESGLCEADVPIPGNVDCGEWVVQQLAVKDKAGNTTLLVADSPLLARAGFQVSSGSGCDFTPPTLDAFDLSPAVVPGGTATEILVTAKVYDGGSGTARVTGWFEGPVAAGGQAPKNHFTCSPDPGDPESSWTCKVQVPPLAARGTWKVGAIRLEDKALNFRVYASSDPVVSGRVFEVQ